MNCDDQRLQMYIDGELGELETQIFMQHLRFCARCRRELNRMKVLDWDLRHRLPAAPPRELLQLRRSVLDTCQARSRAAEKSTDAPGRMRMATLVLRNSTTFVRFFPGASAIHSAMRRKSKPKRPYLARLLLDRVSFL